MREYLLIACPNLRQEIQAIMEVDNLRYEVMWLPEELHQSPDRLRAYLDQTISQLKDVERVLLPMGRCGNGTIGVHSYAATLILPKCDDCIDLLLSGEDLAHVSRPERTYFFTDGWLKGERSFLREYAYMCRRFSEETARELAGMIYRNYRQFGYIDTGFGSFAHAAAQTEALAKAVGVKTVCLPGRYEVLRQMLRGQLDSDDFIVVPPGHAVEQAYWQR